MLLSRRSPRYGYRRIRALLAGEGWKASRPNEVWSWDFVHDRTENGVALTMLTLIDEYSWQCLSIEVARKLKSKDVLDAVAEVIARRGAPAYLPSDNGPEFIAREVQEWLAELGGEHDVYRPRQPVAERPR
ncbi:MAG: DDE-type integrase/transposase/recombinase [Verrucomicrobiales bacterium]|nr:DDE-type integrase/transposase/recombinase [Verrucomicrobiales bacterium]